MNPEVINQVTVFNGMTLEEALRTPANYDIERLEGQLLAAQDLGIFPRIDIPTTHRFAPGIYAREIFAPAGSFIIGHEHTTENMNIMLQGVATVVAGGNIGLMAAPFTFVSGPGVRKVAYAHEDMIWMSIHPNPHNIRDIQALEDMFIIKSETFVDHLRDLETLKRALQKPA